MPAQTPRVLLQIRYYQAAQDYLRKLPPEHFMEATPQATQREITLESLDLVHARRPAVQIFNELLVQYPVEGRKKPKQVVPDNMVVLHPEPIKAEGSFDVVHVFRLAMLPFAQKLFNHFAARIDLHGKNRIMPARVVKFACCFSECAMEFF